MRFLQPRGEKVVFLKAQVEIGEFESEAKIAVDEAVASTRDLLVALSKEYFGTELTLDGLDTFCLVMSASLGLLIS